MLPNTLQSPVVLFGILRAGMVIVNVNPQYTVPELEHLRVGPRQLGELCNLVRLGHWQQLREILGRRRKRVQV